MSIEFISSHRSSTFRLIAFVFSYLLGCLSIFAQTQIVYVDQARAGGDGTSWENAYRELSTALDAVNPTENNPVEIWVAKGVYKPTASSDRSVSFNLKSHLTIRGGFEGDETNLDGPRLFANRTVLSGDIGQTVSPSIDFTEVSLPDNLNLEGGAFADNSYSVVKGESVESVVLDGLYIFGGNANSARYDTGLYFAEDEFSDPHEVATAILGQLDVLTTWLYQEASTSLRNLLIASAPESEQESELVTALLSHINSQMDDPRLADALLGESMSAGVSTLRDGYVSGSNGHRIFLRHFIEDAFSSGIQGRDDNGSLLAWMAIPEGTPGVVGVAPGAERFVGNSALKLDADVAGGGLFLQGSSKNIVISGCHFIFNQAAGFGGALCLDESNAYIASSIFEDNLANYFGGAVFGQNQNSVFEGSYFYNNQANYAGGGVYTQHIPSKYTVAIGSKMSSDVREYLYTTFSQTVLVNLADQFEGVVDFDGVVVSAQQTYRESGGGLQTVMSEMELGQSIGDVLSAWKEYETAPELAFDFAASVVMAVALDAGWIDTPVDDQIWRFKRQQGFAMNSARSSFFYDCEFEGNEAATFGGGLYVQHESASIESSIFRGNHATNGGGGLLFADFSRAHCVSSVFVENSTEAGASAILAYNHTKPKIINCTVVGNSVLSGPGEALYSEAGTETTVSNSIFWANADSDRPSGADISGAHVSNLTPNLRAQYEKRDAVRSMFVSLTEVSHSVIQSHDEMAALNHSAEASDQPRVFPPGFSVDLNDVKNGNQSEKLLDTIEDEIQLAIESGAYERGPFINTGQGIRYLDTNFGDDPLLTQSFRISNGSIALNRGSRARYSNSEISPLGRTDLDGDRRFKGESIDIGAVEGTIPGPNVFVNINAPVTSAENGQSWDDAYTDLGYALSLIKVANEDRSANGLLPLDFTVKVAAGIYLPSPALENSDGDFVQAEIDNPRRMSFVVPEGVTLIGGFSGAGDELSDSPTILSGNLGVQNAKSDNVYTVLVLEENSFGSVENLTIEGGNASVNLESKFGYGGGVYFEGSTSLVNCVIRDNRALLGGGGIAMGSASAEIVDCEIIDNYSFGDGGGVYASQGIALFTNCLFANNEADGTAPNHAGRGGAVEAFNSRTDFETCTFRDNQALSGGAISASNQTLTLESCELYDNRAVYTDTVYSTQDALQLGHGGALLVHGGETTVDHSTFYQNSAEFATTFTQGGGAIFLEYANADFSIENSILYQNSVVNAHNGTTTVERQQLDFFDVAGEWPFVDQSLVEGLAEYQIDYRALSDGTEELINNFDVDPLFVDAANYDFTLSVYSPLLDVQRDLKAYYGSDIVGANRLFGEGVDVGARELQTARQATDRVVIGLPTYIDNRKTYQVGLGGSAFDFSEQDIVDPDALLRAIKSGNLELANYIFQGLQEVSSPLYQYPADRRQGFLGLVNALATDATAIDSHIRSEIEAIDPSLERLIDTVPFAASSSIASAFDTLTRTAPIRPAPLASQLSIVLTTVDDVWSVQVFDTDGTLVFEQALSGDEFAYTLEGLWLALARTHGGSLSLDEYLNQDWKASQLDSFYYAVIRSEVANAMTHSFNQQLVDFFNALIEGEVLLTAEDLDAGGWAESLQLLGAGSTLETYRVGDDFDFSGLTFKQRRSLNRQILDDIYGDYFVRGTLLDEVLFGADPKAFTEEDVLEEIIFELNEAIDGHLQYAALYDAFPGLLNSDLFTEATRALIAQEPIEEGLIALNRTLLLEALDGYLESYQVDYTDIGLTNIVYQWEFSRNDGFGYFDVVDDAMHSNSTTAQLDIGSMDPSMDGYNYRLRITGDLPNAGGAISLYTGSFSIDVPSIYYVSATPVLIGGNEYQLQRDGKSWFTAFNDLQDALDVAERGSEIWLAQGSYTPSADCSVVIDNNGDIDFEASECDLYTPEQFYKIESNVSIYGGFEALSGQEGNFGLRDPVTFPTVIEGEIGDPNRADDNVLNLFTVNSDGLEVYLDGLTLQHAAGAAVHQYYDSDLSVSNCVFLENRGTGPAIFSREGSLSVVESVFMENVGHSYGGAIQVADASIVDCYFRGNRTTYRGGAIGGFGEISILNSVFLENESEYEGGTIYMDTDQPLILTQCSLANNRSNNGSGGVTVTSGDLTVQNTILWGNQNFSGLNFETSDQFRQQGNGVLTIDHSIIQYLDTMGVGVTDSLALNPLFDDIENGQLSLSSFSPGIDAGDPTHVGSLTTDFLQAARVKDIVDIGAYEFQGVKNSALSMLDIQVPPSVCSNSIALELSAAFPVAASFDLTWQVSVDGGAFSPVVDDDVAYDIAESSTESVLSILGDSAQTATNRYRFIENDSGYVSAPMSVEVHEPNVVFVDIDATTASDDPEIGSSWAKAYPDLSDAVDVADGCSELWIAEGTYLEASVSLQPGMSLYGGFAGTESSKDHRVPDYNETIIQHAPVAVDDFYGRVLNFYQSSDSNDREVVVLENLTLDGPGTGVNVHNGTLSVSNCRFSGSGYGITGRYANVYVQDTRFSDIGFSAIWVSSGALDVETSEIVDSQIESRASVYIDQSTATLQDVLFQNITGGAGILVQDGIDIWIDRCLLLDQSSAVELTRSESVVIQNTVIARNAQGIYSYDSGLELINSVIYENSSPYYAGVELAVGGSAKIVNSILWKNRSEHDLGYGASIEQSQLSVQASRSGSVPSVSVSYTSIESLDTYAGNGNVAWLPAFVAPDLNDFSLPQSSPLLNAGDDGVLLTYTLPTDLAGNARVYEGQIDIGAYEQQADAVAAIQVTSGPESISVCENRSVTFEVEGASAAGVEWYFYNQYSEEYIDLPAEARFQTEVEGDTARLTINPTSLSDGIYQLVYRIDGYNSLPIDLTLSEANQSFVNAGASGANDGSSWLNAYTTIEAALAAATGCTDIWIAEGDYYPVGTLDLKEDTRLLGGFDVGDSLEVHRKPETNLTRVFGDGSQSLIYATGTLSRNAVVDGLHLDGQGASAVYVRSQARPSIVNCFFDGTDDYGIRVIEAGQPLVEACRFTGNSDTTIRVDNGSIVLRDSLWMNNQDERGVAAIRVSNEFSDGPSTVLMERCVFTGNESGDSMIELLGDVTISVNASQFDNNHSDGSGGCFSLGSEVRARFENTLFFENVSEQNGGAISYAGDSMELVNVTLSANTASGNGGGLYASTDGVSVVNSILWSNRDSDEASAGESEQLTFASDTIDYSVGHSLVEGLEDLAATNSISENPLFTAPFSGDFSLSLYSPAVDAGENGEAPASDVDLAGAARIFGSIDLGAYETTGTRIGDVNLLAVPASQAACAGDSIVFEVVAAAEDDGYSFVWEFSDDGENYSPIIDDTVHVIEESAKGSSLTIHAASEQPTARAYRANILIDDSASGFVTSDAFITASNSDIIYVVYNGTGDKSGSDWANAVDRIEDAILIAGDCSQIWVENGQYPLPADYVISKSVAIYGGFNGTENQLSDRAQPLSGTSVISTFDVYSSGTRAILFDGIEFNESIEIFDTAVDFSNCEFSDVDSDLIFAFDAELGFTNCEFLANTAPVLNALGSTVAMSDSMVSGNNVRYGALFEFNTGSSGMFERVSLQDNFSQLIELYDASDLAIENSLIAGNVSAYGAVIEQSGGSLELRHTTVTDNFSGSSASTLLVEQGTASVENSILWGNSGTHSDLLDNQLLNNGGSLTITSSAVQYIADGVNLAVDPLFENPGLSDYRLSAFSPLVDAGDLQSVGASSIDLDHSNRVFNTLPDLGAFELQQVQTNQLVLNQQASGLELCPNGAGDYSLEFAADLAPVIVWQQKGPSDGSFSNVDFGESTYSRTDISTASQLQLQTVPQSYDEYEYRYMETSSGYVSPAFSLDVSEASVLYVDQSVASNGDGTTWGTAFDNLYDAIDAASACHQIWVAEGSYLIDESLILKEGLQIYGGFEGGESLLEYRDPATHVTQLQAVGDDAILLAYSDASAITRASAVEGFTFTANPDSLTSLLILWSSSPIVRDCIFENSQGVNAVEIVYDSRPLFERCIFQNNTNDNGYGGAVVAFSSQVEFQSCTFSSNVSAYGGGAVHTYDGSADFVDCAFIDNSAQLGGAILADGEGQALWIDACEFVGNSTTGAGGALNVGDMRIDIYNTIFRDNTADHEGGAIALYRCDSVIVNSTIVDNFSVGSVGGLTVQNGQLAIYNSILWGNEDDYVVTFTEAEQLSGDAITVFNSIVQGLDTFASEVSNLGYDPLFMDPENANYQLSPFSTAVNSGDNTAIGSTHDLAGNSRKFGTVDLGAYELQTAAATPFPATQVPMALDSCVSANNSFTVAFDSDVPATVTWQLDLYSSDSFVDIADDTRFVVRNEAGQSTLEFYPIDRSLTTSRVRFLIDGQLVNDQSYLITLSDPDVIYVDAGAAVGGDGSSWQDAYINLQVAIEAAGSCQEIWLKDGVYTPDAGGELYTYFELRSELPIYGGFAGTETARDQRDWESGNTILIGSDSNTILNNGNYTAIDRTAVLDGVVIRNSDSGVLVDNSFASPTFRNVTLIDSASYGVWNDTSDAIFENCVFTNNAAGAARSQNNSNSVFVDCRFEGNLEGGLTVFDASYVRLADCHFENNASSSPGGAINIFPDASVLAERCVFIANSSSSGGGAISNNGDLTVTNSLFRDCNSGNYGGAIRNNGSLLIENSTFYNNEATFAGGGLEINSGSDVVVVTNSIFWRNSVLQNNEFVEDAQIKRSAPVLTLTNSVVMGLDALSGNGNLPYDPQFNDPDNGDFSLFYTSPLVNQGDASVTAVGNQDLASNDRVFDSAIDIGAYEFRGSQTSQDVVYAPFSVSDAYCLGRSATYSFSSTEFLGAQYSNVLYEWQVSTGGDFITIEEGAPYWIESDADSSTFSINPVDQSMVGWTVRLLVRDAVTQSRVIYTSPETQLQVVDGVAYVDADASDGGDGLSWGSAFNDLQDALTSNLCFSQIWIAEGSYYPVAANGSETVAFDIPAGVQLLGGFAGHENSVDDRMPHVRPTLFSGDFNQTPNDSSDDSRFVVRINGSEDPVLSSTVLDGLIIERSRLGMSVIQASPSISNCTVRYHAEFALQISNSELMFSNVSIVDNVTVPGSDDVPVAIVGGEVSFVDCLIANNASDSGAVNIDQATVRFDRTSLNQNQSYRSGGAIFSNEAELFIENSKLQGNVAAQVGGALQLTDTDLKMVNSLVAGNALEGSGGGAGINSFDGHIFILNSTIAANAALNSNDAGGIEANLGSLNIQNSILWGNVCGGPSGEAQQIQYTSVSPLLAADSIIQEIDVNKPLLSSGGYSSSYLDPMFSDAPIVDGLGTVLGDFSLQACSPAVDMGFATAWIDYYLVWDEFAEVGENVWVVDLAGELRVIGDSVDVGAYEVTDAVETTFEITQQPTTLFYDAGGVNELDVTVVGTDLSYQWQVDYGLGAGFQDLINDGQFSGVTQATLTISNATLEMNSYTYRCVITNENACSIRTSQVSVIVKTQRFYVDATAAASGDGLSWATAFDDLQTALEQRDSLENMGAEIWVAAGTYLPTQFDDVNAFFPLYNELAIYGGFAGDETALEQRDWSANPTILSGDLGVVDDAADNSQKLISRISTEVLDASAVLDGFIVEDAVIGISALGGSSAPQIRNCTFRDHKDHAVRSNLSDPRFYSCIFENNGNLSIQGGAVHNIRNESLFESCTFRGNSAEKGGAVYNHRVDLSVFMNCVFSGNVATNEGGAVYLFDNRSAATPTIEFHNSTIANNYCSAAGNTGGGIYATEYAKAFIFNSILWGNVANGLHSESTNLDHTNGIGEHDVYSTILGGLSVFFVGSGNLDIDPLFVQSVAASSTPTTAGDYQLSVCSPAIEAGDNFYLNLADDYVSVDFDLVGASRIFDSGIVDLGAYELQSSPWIITQQPVDLYAHPDGMYQLSVDSNLTTGITYQWQQGTRLIPGDPESDLVFTDLVSAEPFYRVTERLMVLEYPSLSLDGSFYRCVLLHSSGCQLVSDELLLTVEDSGGALAISSTQDWDFDTLPDVWEVETFGSIFDERAGPEDDPDGDGQGNYFEYVVGLNPLDSEERLEIQLRVDPLDPEQHLVELWPTAAGRSYEIEFSTDLDEWNPISLDDSRSTTGKKVYESTTGTQRFYRINVSLDP